MRHCRVAASLWALVAAHGQSGEPLRLDFSPSPLSRILARAGDAKQTLVCPRCAARPKIDGQLDDPAWETSAVIEKLLFANKETALPQTRVRVCFDARSLYIGVECEQRAGAAIQAAARPRDKGTWKDDCIEVWIDPSLKQSPYYQFVVNAAGAVYDAECRRGSGNEAHDPAWEHAAKQAEARWAVEMAIPKEALGLTRWPSRLALNIGRNGPGLQLRSWTGDYGDATGGVLALQGVAEPAAAGRKRKSAARGALGMTLLRDSARPGERWIEAALDVQAADEQLGRLRVTAAIFDIGVPKPVAQASAAPERREGRVLVDLRTLKLSQARLFVSLLEGRKRIGMAEALLSAREPDARLKPGQRIPVKLDLPEGIDAADAWPVTFGLPFAAGTLWDAGRVRLIDAQSREIPTQIEVAGRWAKDGAVKWLRVDALVSTEDGCEVELAKPGAGAAPAKPVGVAEQGDHVVMDTGLARYVLARGPSPITEVWLADRRVATTAGTRGLYVVDQRGRLATASAESETLAIEARGPIAACARFEGFYKTADGEQLARHITRVEAFAGQPFAKVTHTLILTRDTNEVWFRDVGWEFRCEPGAEPTAIFGVSRDEWRKSFEQRLDAQTPCAYMLQDRHYRFAHGANHFLVARAAPHGKAATVLEGEECGDWAALAGERAALGLACKEAARQHPKEFEVHRDRVVLHLFSHRAGEELDFRTPACIERWDLANWYQHALGQAYKNAGQLDKVRQYTSNAIGWAKTHELLVTPLPPKQAAAQMSRFSYLHRQRVLALVDPRWTYKTEVIGRIHPKDPKRFPRLEKLIEGTARVWERRVHEWGEYGFIDYYAGPHLSYRGKYPVPGRYCPYTYTLRGDLWLAYARSGDRRILELAESTNRSYLDNVFTHWDGNGKVRGLWNSPLGGDSSLGETKASLPFYWEARPTLNVSSSSNLDNFVLLYYLTGYRRAKDLVLEYADGAKRFWTVAKAKRDWRGIMTMRLLAQAYAFTWDPELRALAEATADTFVDPEGELGLSKDRPYRSTSYKTQVDIAGLLDAWDILGTQRYHDLSVRIAQFWWESFLGKWPIFYTNPQGRIANFLYRETGDPSYAQGLTLQVRQVATAYDPDTDHVIGKLDGRIGAEDSTFVFQGIPYGQDLMVRSGAHAGAVSSWAGCEDFGYAVSFVAHKRDGEVLEILFKTQSSEPGAVGGVRLRPVAAGTTAGQNLSRIAAVSNGTMVVRVPKDAPEGAYEIVPEVAGCHYALAKSKAPLVVHAPRFWRPVPAQAPAVKWYFQVPPGARDGQVFFEAATKLFDPEGQPYPKDEAVSGWIDLPSGRPGLWSFEAIDNRLVRVRNVPPFFAAEDPKHYFTPKIAWEREEIPPAPVKVPAGTVFVPGAIQTEGNQALYLDGRRKFILDVGHERDSGNGYQFVPFQQGTIEFFFKPDWSTYDLPAKAYKTLVRLPSTGEEWRLSHNKDMSAKLWMLSHVLYGYFYTDGPKRRITMRAYRRTILERDKWSHIAWVWGTRDAPSFKTQARSRILTAKVFVDGKAGQSYSYKWEGNQPADRPRMFRLAYIDATYDELRLSDVPRYWSDFARPARDRELRLDKHTRALFHFNGDLEGQSYGFTGALPARLE